MNNTVRKGRKSYKQIWINLEKTKSMGHPIIDSTYKHHYY